MACFIIINVSSSSDLWLRSFKMLSKDDSLLMSNQVKKLMMEEYKVEQNLH